MKKKYEDDIKSKDITDTNNIEIINSTKNITTINPNYIIEKANSLIISDMDFTRRELILLDCYLSLINPRNKDIKTVVIKKSALEKLLNTQIKIKELEKNIEHLLKTIITIRNSNGNGEFIKFTLFQGSACRLNDDGEWEIHLTCSDYATQYMFNIEQVGYTRFQLKDIISLTTDKSIRLAQYLLYKRYQHTTFDMPIDELKRLLNCTSKSYEDFNKFKTRFLNPIIEEINDKLSQFFYVEYKKINGNNHEVTHIRFILSKPKEYEKKLFEEMKELEKKQSNNLLEDINNLLL